MRDALGASLAYIHEGGTFSNAPACFASRSGIVICRTLDRRLRSGVGDFVGEIRQPEGLVGRDKAPIATSRGSIFDPFPRLQSKQSERRLSSTVLPPAATGRM